MDEEKILVMLKGEDKTKDIEYFSKCNNSKIEIKFYKNTQKYTYKERNVIIKEEPILINLKEKDVYYKNQILFNIEKVIRFEEFVKIIYISGETEVFRYNDLSFKSNLIENLNKNVIQYFKEISNYVKSGKEEEEEYEEKQESFLKREYEKLNYINEESILNYYINKIDLMKSTVW